MIRRWSHKAIVFLCFALLASAFLGAQERDAAEQEYNTLFQQALGLKNRDQQEQALQTLDRAANLAEEQLQEKWLIDCYHLFAQIYLEMDKKDQADFSTGRAHRMLEDIEYPSGLAEHYYVDALLFYRESNFYQALGELNQAKQQTNQRNLLNRITLLEADINRSIQKLEQAETKYNSLLVNNDPLEPEYLKTKAYLGLAELEATQERNEEAINNAQGALTLARTNLFSKELYRATELLQQLYEKNGQFNEALTTMRTLGQLKDSIYNLKKLEVETQTAYRVTIEHQDKTISKLEGENDNLKKSANRSELATILTSAFLTIISLLAVSLYRNNQIKLKTNDLLHTKNRELQAARDAAVQAMEAKTNFLSTVSHELRTPLYAVTGLTHLLLEENPNEAQKEHLKALKFSGDYLLNFINDILQINKIDADKLEPLEIEFNLKKVLTEVMNSLQQTAKERNTELVLEFDPKIPGQLMSDPLKLSQIFMNLVGNALKFTKDGEVMVLAKLVNREEDAAKIYFEVRDNGIGIAPDQQEKIFDSFEQGSIQINREYGGTGLGLSIVKSLLGLFGSNIQLESEPGKGSSFYFELGFKCKDSLVDDIPFEMTQKEYDFKGLHLLVVEDNKINQVITRKMLSKREISCDVASNGLDAVELAGKNTYDGILMDIHMPGISGVEATERIRGFDPDTPIIALTAISLDDSLETFYAAGCNDVVTKPFKPEVFYQKIGENIVEHKVRKSIS